MPDQSILWNRLDRSGHESARLSLDPSSGWRLAGAAIFAHDGQPCLLNYQIHCDTAWRTMTAEVVGWVGDVSVRVSLARDNADRWSLNGEEQPAVTGCVDLDLNFSPATNLLPIRRLNLPAGQSADVRAAWLRFPELTLEPLPQTYRHTGETTYRYESSDGEFIVDLFVNAAGLVTRYPGYWEAVATSG